jgi:hypothetical protein
MDREDFPARHPGCPAGDAPEVTPIFLHRGVGGRGLYAHYVCSACGGWRGRWCARVDAASREAAA